MIAFYYFLLFICDNLIASNRGFTRNPIVVLFNPCIRAKKKNLKKKIEQQKMIGGDKAEDDLSEGDNNGSVLDKNGIVLKNISKSYKMSCRRKGLDSDWALKDVNLNIKKGELFGLLGPNGAGKTTMIGLLSGVLDPTVGDFFSSGLNGKYESWDIRKITNVCPQFDILWAELTIYDHIQMICDIKGLKDIKLREYAIELMSQVNLVDSLDERISNLSGGMRRRVSIALATIGDPKVTQNLFNF